MLPPIQRDTPSLFLKRPEAFVDRNGLSTEIVHSFKIFWSVLPMKYDVFGVGNALVDIQARISENWLASTGFDKGIMTLVDDAQQKAVLDRLAGTTLNRCAGGSAANTIVGVADFG